MPEISRFFGITIRMSFKKESAPHFHVGYEHHRAVVAINPPALVAGQVPPRVLALAIEWALIHRVELLANWESARNGEALRKIAPLE